MGYTLNNDGGGLGKFNVGGSFVNGEPVLDGEFELARRQKIDVRLSNLQVAYLVKYGAIAVGYIPKQ